MNLYQFGYIGIGMCSRCSSPAHTWVHSFYEGNQQVCCEQCLRRLISQDVRYMPDVNRETIGVGLSYSLDNLPSSNPDILASLESVPLCENCHQPEYRPREDTSFISALTNGGDTVEVHLRCSVKCDCCDVRYISGTWLNSEHSPVWLEPIGGSHRCPSCVQIYLDENGGEDNFFTCENCDERHTMNALLRWNRDSYCESCYDDNVGRCDDCDMLIWYGNDHDCEFDDESDDNDSVIHNHSYRPSYEFFGNGNYYLGFELEVESRNSSRHDGAQFVQDVLGGHAYIKEDGSLSDGFEIVTHPHTLNEYQSNFDWGVLESLKRKGYRSWNTDTCGIHIHVSRSAFDSQDVNSRSRRIILRQAHELRFMKLIYDNQRQVERIAGRTNCHYASFQDKGALVRKVKDGYQDNGRYSAVNTENSSTLEVRVFKGSLRKERVLSAIEFVTASVEYTRGLSVTGKNRALTWLHFTAYISANIETYPNLALIMAESFNTDTPIDGITNDN